MAAYKISSDIVWSSQNFDSVIGGIEKRLKAIPPIAVSLDTKSLNQLKQYLSDIEKTVSRIGKTGGLGNFGKIPTATVAGIKNAKRGFEEFKSAVVHSENELEKFGRVSAATVRRFGAFVLISNIFNAVSNSFRDGLKRAVEFDKQMYKISQVSGLTRSSLKEMEGEITHLSTSLGVSSTKLTDVALTLAQAGLSAKDTKTALAALAKTELSATFDDIKNTTEGVIAIMSQFKVQAGDLEKELSAINTVSAKFAVESSDIVTAVRTAGGAFQAAGGNLKEFYSLFTSVRATTRESAESIATGLRTITTRLQRPRTQNFLKEMGIDLRDAKGEFMGIYPAVEKLSAALKDVSGNDPRFAQILEEVAGYRQIAKFIPMLRNFETAQKALTAAQGANNSLSKDAIIAQQSLANAITKTKEEFDALLRKIVDDNSFKVMAKSVLGIASAFIQMADSIRPLIPLLTVLGSIYAVQSTNVIGKAFVSDLLPSLSKGKSPLKRARGGFVPGSGSGDTVPAMLEPGEFVVRKSAAQAIGAAGLHGINKFAGGGRVGMSPKIFESITKGKNKQSIYNSILRDHQDVLQNIPKNSTWLGSGAEAIAFKTPDGKVIRLGMINDNSREVYKRTDWAGQGVGNGTPINMTRRSNQKYGHRPRGAAMLQPLVRKRYGKILYEELPFAEDLESLLAKGKISYEQVEQYTKQAKDLAWKSGMGVQDEHNGNIGLVNGKPIFIDPGALYALPNERTRGLKRRGYAGGGTVAQLKDLFSKGGLRRSLGLDHAGGHFGGHGWTGIQSYLPGDANYANGSWAYPGGWTRPNGKTLPVSYPLTPNPTLTSSQKRINLNLIRRLQDKNTLAGFVKTPISSFIPQVPEDIRYRKRSRGYLGSKKSVSEKIRLRKMLEDFQAKTGINPAGLISRLNIEKLPKGVGSYRGSDRSVRIYSDKIGASVNPALRTVRGTLYHELGHAIDFKHDFVNPRGTASSERAGSNERFLSDIYRSHELPNRESLFQKNLIGREYLDYAGQEKEEFANFVSEFLRGKLRGTQNYSETSSRFKKVLAEVAQLSNVVVSHSRGTLDDTVDLRRGIRKSRFATGGGVPGSGNADTVPALLTPGEFVVNKKSAQAFGYGNLHKVNKYAKGGPISAGAFGTAAFLGPQIAGTVANGLGGEKYVEAIQPFIAALTVAGGALLLFSQTLQKDGTAEVKHRKQLLEDQRNLSEKPGLLKSSYGKSKISLIRTQQLEANKLRKIVEGETTYNLAGGPNGLSPKGLAAQDQLNKLRDTHRERYQQGESKYNRLMKDYSDKTAMNAGERIKAKNKLAGVRRYNRIVVGTGIGVALGEGAAYGLNSYGSSQIAAGNHAAGRVSSVAGGVVGGLATGAGLGAMSGNPWGIAIGAVVGALGGLWHSLNSTTSEIDSADTGKKIKKFGEILDAVNTGKSTFGKQRGNIQEFLQYANKGYMEKTDSWAGGNNLSNFKGEIGQSTEALNQYLDSLIKQSDSSKKLIEENQDLILVLSRFGGQTIGDLEKKIRDGVQESSKGLKAQKDYNKIVNENNARLEALLNIGGAVGDAERSAGKVGNRADLLDQMMNGYGSAKAHFDFSALSDVGSARLSDVREQATRAGSLVGGPGVGLGADVISAAEVVRKLPSILNEMVYSPQLNGEEHGLTDKLRGKLGQGFAQDLVMEQFSHMLSAAQDSTKFTAEFKKDPLGTTKQLQAAIQPIVDVLADAAPKIVSALDGFADGLAAARQNFFRNLEGLSKSIDIEEVGADIGHIINGTHGSFAESQGFDTRRGNLLSGGRSIAQLGADLSGHQTEIGGLSAQMNTEKDPLKLKDLTKKMDDAIKASEQETKALEFSADVNSRLAAANKELEKIQKGRELRKDMATGFIFGDPAAKKEIVKGLLGAGQIQSNLGAGKNAFEGVSPQMRQSALEVFKSFSDIKAFNGESGQEIIDKIIKNQGFEVGQSQTEKDAGVAAQAIVQAAQDAQDILNKNLTSVNTEFVSKIGEKFDKFIADLKVSIGERIAEAKVGKEGEKGAKLKGLDEQEKFLNSLRGLAGVNPDNPKSITALRNAIPQLKKARDLIGERGEIQDLLGKTGAGKVTEAELSKFISQEKIKELHGLPEHQISGFSGLTIKPREEATIAELNRINKDKQKEINELVGTSQNNLGNKSVEMIKLNLDIIANGLSKIAEEVSLEKIGKEKSALRRARGGSIWTPNGTDTVPAMLTPGEFVMRREAVNRIGVGNLSRMNHFASGGSVNDTSFVDMMRKKRLEEERVKKNRNSYMGGTDEYTNKNGYKRVIEKGNSADARPYRPGRDGHSTNFQPSVWSENRFEVNRDIVLASGRMKTQQDNARAAYQRNSPRAQEARLRNEQIKQEKIALRNSKKLGGFSNNGGFFGNSQPSQVSQNPLANTPPIPVNPPIPNNKPPTNNPPANHPAGNQGACCPPINPQLMKEFNDAVNKLAGAKLEISLNGSLNVNISEGNLNEKVKETLREFAKTYVEDKIMSAINGLVKDANLAVLPKAGKVGGIA